MRIQLGRGEIRRARSFFRCWQVERERKTIGMVEIRLAGRMPQRPVRAVATDRFDDGGQRQTQSPIDPQRR